ncbi:uncharacterized protein PF3D7_1120000-like [Vigna umbellata]|uniref:uncharacterized protein PF3D7_1120000-like n=1 Tax=Vigna umbellata TaxID=87088 RepID=UPI001F5F2411|nr:uncharacterized protein PF3D7_1120000-like [Vigna umbellata]
MSCSTGVEFETMFEQLSHLIKEKILRDRNEEQKFMTSLWEDCLKLNSVRKQEEGSKKEIQELREEIQELREEIKRTKEEIKRTKEEYKRTKEEIQGLREEFERKNAEMDERRKDSKEVLNMLMGRLADIAVSL